MADRGLCIYVRLQKRSWLRRVFRLSGIADTVVEYNARRAGVGYSDVTHEYDNVIEHQAVLVDGVNTVGAATSETLPTFQIASRDGPLRGLIRVDLSTAGLLVRIERLVFTVAGERLYEETGGKTVWIKHPPALPLPARAGPAARKDLPVPADTPWNEIEDVPAEESVG